MVIKINFFVKVMLFVEIIANFVPKNGFSQLRTLSFADICLRTSIAFNEIENGFKG